MKREIENYNHSQIEKYQAICNQLARCINQHLPEAENKIWHRHPVWFLEGNPVVGYSVQKPGVRLMFWSGADFGENELKVLGKKFKDASVFFTETSQINEEDLIRWIEKSRTIQWDYKNIVKRRGKLVRIV